MINVFQIQQLKNHITIQSNYKQDCNVSIHCCRLPEPALPVLSLFSELVWDSLIIAVVAYGFSLSMGKVIAKKFNYSINGNQELMGEVMFILLDTDSNCYTNHFLDCINSAFGISNFALQGFCNIFGSFFRCIPSAASMSRSLAVASSGGKTQLTGFLSAVLLIFVLLWIGPLFEQLPKVTIAYYKRPM